MVSAKRNIQAVLAALERRMTLLEEAREINPVGRAMSDEGLLELALVYAEIADANQMSYPEALVRLLGLDPDKAQTIAQRLGPLAEKRREQRMQLHHDSL